MSEAGDMLCFILDQECALDEKRECRDKGLKQMRSALAFYADKKNWAAQYDPELSPVEADEGKRARKALRMSKEGKP